MLASLAKLREYHGSFKSICDTFSIDKGEFSSIFGNKTEGFEIWDEDNNGLIDALELFSGLILFSESKFEDKIRCTLIQIISVLFDLFDFNEMNSLSLIDVEFLLNCSISSTFKICRISTEVNQEEISKFVCDSFTDDARINISQLIKWCVREDRQEIREYFTIIKRDLPTIHKGALDKQVINGKKIDPVYLSTTTQKPFKAIDFGYLINSKEYLNKTSWISSIAKKLNYSYDQRINIKDLNISMNWVYGIRCTDVLKSFCYYKNSMSSTDECLIYFTACIVVVYYFKLNEQQHYVEHQSDVSAVTVSDNGLVASGDRGKEASVHIWDLKTFKSKIIFSTYHKDDVVLLKFVNNGQYLTVCGKRLLTPVVIYDVVTGSIVLSTNVDQFVRQILSVNYLIGSLKVFSSEQNIVEKFFILLGSTKIYFFESNEYGVYETRETSIEEAEVNADLITSGSVFLMNKDNPQLKAYADNDSKELVLLTGHKDGKVLIWRYDNEEFNFVRCLSDYKHEIIDILYLESSVGIATEDSFIYLWDLSFRNFLKSIDLSDMPVKLYSLKLKDIVPAGNKIFFNTYEGDMIELHLKMRKEWSKNSFIVKYDARRIKNIVQFKDNLTSLTLIERNEEKVIFAGGEAAINYGLSTETHELIDRWSVGDSITAMDSLAYEDGGIIFAFGSAKGRIMLRIDWEEIPKIFNLEKAVTDIKFSSDAAYLIVACENQKLYVFNYNNNSYFQFAPKELNFDQEIPVSINFCDDNRVMIIGTNTRNHYKLDLPEMKNKNLVQESDSFNISLLRLKYPSHIANFSDKLSPILLGQELKYIVAGDETGVVTLWKDEDQLDSNCGTLLRGHSSRIRYLAVTKHQDFLYTLGYSDNTIIEWKVDLVTGPLQENRIKNTRTEKLSVGGHIVEDEMILRELYFCSSFKENSSTRLRDTLTLFRGTTHKMLNAIISKDMDAFDETNAYNKRYPELSLTLNHVYGFEAYDRRNTLMYVEDYDEIEEQNESESTINDSILMRYYKLNNASKRFYCYFTSRVAIIADSDKLQQKFYEGHKNKISCMVAHPSRSIVATGETSESPQIHIWGVRDCSPLKVITTDHGAGIINMAFSKDGSFLVSLGMDQNFSIQVTNWKTEEKIAFKNSSPSPLLDVKFNPYNKYEFIICGYHNVQIWNIVGKSLLVKDSIEINEGDKNTLPYITAIDYCYYRLGNVIETDLIVGTHLGDLGLVSKGNYIQVRRTAHKKMINCLKVTDVFSETVLIFTSGEDEHICVWDSSFKKLCHINIRESELQDIKDRNLSCQSIDIFFSSTDKIPQPLLLVGTRDGNILEYNMEAEFNTTKERISGDDASSISSGSISKESVQANIQIHHINFKPKLLMRNHAVQMPINEQAPAAYFNHKKLMIAMHPKLDILVTIGNDKMLCLWNTKNMTRVHRKNLGKLPTCIKWNPDGTLLVVGFDDGMLKIYESKIGKMTFGNHSGSNFFTYISKVRRLSSNL